MRSTLIVAAVLVSAVATGCATTSSSSAHRNTGAHVGAGAQQFVDDQMSQALSSIDQSLKTLVVLERGGEAPRKAGPIGTTVAGAAGASRPVVQPPPPPADVSVLEKRARIQWNGSASELLSTLAKGIGYTYREVGASRPLTVRLPDQELTIKELLSSTAAQIDGKAGIRLNTNSRQLELEYGAGSSVSE